MYEALKNITFIIFDLDGVFYREDQSIEGTKEIIDYLNEKNIEYCFFTNNSTYKIHRYKEKLLSSGVDVSEKNIYTTTKLIEHFLFENNLNNIYVLGSKQLQENLYEKYNKNENKPDIVILGMENNITLKDISNTINLIDEETQIIAANPDKLIPVKNGFELECGVLIDIIEEYTKKIVQVIGKPSSYGFNTILSKFGKENYETLMIGDTFETDILGAKNANIHAGWINSGNKLPNDTLDFDFMSFNSLIELKEKIKEAKR
jgi:HAD superfamily hydrolase (TIGR01450 family)